jgi:hypothetical protein
VQKINRRAALMIDDAVGGACTCQKSFRVILGRHPLSLMSTTTAHC